MNNEIKNVDTPYTPEMQEAFYVEELEDRYEMAAALAPSPNLACWEIQF